MSKTEKYVLESGDFECLKHHLEYETIGMMEAAKAVIDLYYKGVYTYVESEAAIRLLAKVKVK